MATDARATTTSPDERRLLLAFTGVFLASLASHVSAFLFVHLPGFLRDAGASETYIGATAALTALTAIAIRPFVGPMMDRHGRKPALVVGGLLHACTAGLYLTTHAPDAWFAVVRALHGVAFGIFFSAVFSTAADLSPAHVRTQRMAIFGISGILPMSLGAVLGSHILDAFGHRGVFLAATCSAALGWTLTLRLPETAETAGTGAQGSVRAALGSPDLRPLWIAGALFSFAVATYFVFVRNFVTAELEVPVSDFFTPYAISAIGVRLLFGGLPARVGEHRTFAAAQLALTAGLIALAASTGTPGVRIAGALCGLGHGFSFPSLLSLFVERSAAGNRATAITLFTALMDVGVLVTGPVFGRVADTAGFPPVFVAAAAFTFTAGVYASLAVRGRNEATVEAGGTAG